MTEPMRRRSPGFVKTSTAGAMSLGLFPGRFHRGATLRALNLLLTYPDGCEASCGYCGLSSERELPEDVVPEGEGVGDGSLSERTFIRVDWPGFSTDRIVEEVRRREEDGSELERVCLSMVTHDDAYDDTMHLVRRFDEETELSISTLITPTLFEGPDMVQEMKEAGADMCGVAVDCVTPELFDRFRGSGVGGPHRWGHYWRTVDWAVESFGEGNVSIHLIVGLGETEEEFLSTVQRVYDAGAEAHLFAHYPEAGSPLEHLGRPSLERYRRVQLSRYLIHDGHASFDDFSFDEAGRVADFGVPMDVVESVVEEGKAFMTSGCRGESCDVACNRPYGNERPGEEELRNYPFTPEEGDRELIRERLGMG